MLRRGWDDRIRLPVIRHHSGRANLNSSGRRNNPVTPVAEPVAIARDRHRWVTGQVIGNYNIGRPRIVNIQHQYHGSFLRTTVSQLVADTDSHSHSLGSSSY